MNGVRSNRAPQDMDGVGSPVEVKAGASAAGCRCCRVQPMGVEHEGTKSTVSQFLRRYLERRVGEPLQIEFPRRGLERLAGRQNAQNCDSEKATLLW